VATPVAPRRTVYAQPVQNAPVRRVPAAQPVAAQRAYAPAAITAQCFTVAPRLETVVLRSGGTALVCTRGDGTLNGWRSPLFPQGAVGAALTPRQMQGATLATTYAAPRMALAVPAPPPGYRLAWDDDRLNPMRGLGTAAGQAQQDQVWTRDIPAQLVTAPQAAVMQAAVPQVTGTYAQPRTSMSTMSAPTRAAAQNYVQVGTFGQPANAAGVKSRLGALGLPVSTSKITRNGKVLQIVYAGPFATPAEARSALATTRNAGFSDAVLK
jgi:septal ring-binding cell division protein DamX